MQRGPVTEPAQGLRGIEAVRLLDTDLPQPCVGGLREDVQAQHDLEGVQDWRNVRNAGPIADRARARS